MQQEESVELFMKISFNSKVVVPDDVIHSQVADELVILHLESESYYGLDEIGFRMWTVFSRSETIEQGIQLLLSEYEVDEETLRKDAISLLETLLDHGLIKLI